MTESVADVHSARRHGTAVVTGIERSCAPQECATTWTCSSSVRSCSSPPARAAPARRCCSLRVFIANRRCSRRSGRRARRGARLTRAQDGARDQRQGDSICGGRPQKSVYFQSAKRRTARPPGGTQRGTPSSRRRHWERLLATTANWRRGRVGTDRSRRCSRGGHPRLVCVVRSQREIERGVEQRHELPLGPARSRAQVLEPGHQGLPVVDDRLRLRSRGRARQPAGLRRRSVVVGSNSAMIVFSWPSWAADSLSFASSSRQPTARPRPKSSA